VGEKDLNYHGQKIIEWETDLEKRAGAKYFPPTNRRNKGKEQRKSGKFWEILAADKPGKEGTEVWVDIKELEAKGIGGLTVVIKGDQIELSMYLRKPRQVGGNGTENLGPSSGGDNEGTDR